QEDRRVPPGQGVPQARCHPAGPAGEGPGAAIGRVRARTRLGPGGPPTGRKRPEIDTGERSDETGQVIDDAPTDVSSAAGSSPAPTRYAESGTPRELH